MNDDTTDKEVQELASVLMHKFDAVGMLAIFVRVTDDETGLKWETQHLGVAVDAENETVIREISDMVDIAFYGYAGDEAEEEEEEDTVH